jgi:hypothetical protein
VSSNIFYWCISKTQNIKVGQLSLIRFRDDKNQQGLLTDRIALEGSFQSLPPLMSAKVI